MVAKTFGIRPMSRSERNSGVMLAIRNGSIMSSYLRDLWQVRKIDVKRLYYADTYKTHIQGVRDYDVRLLIFSDFFKYCQ
jgi:hypothetical protein